MTLRPLWDPLSPMQGRVITIGSWTKARVFIFIVAMVREGELKDLLGTASVFGETAGDTVFDGIFHCSLFVAEVLDPAFVLLLLRELALLGQDLDPRHLIHWRDGSGSSRSCCGLSSLSNGVRRWIFL